MILQCIKCLLKFHFSLHILYFSSYLWIWIFYNRVRLSMLPFSCLWREIAVTTLCPAPHSWTSRGSITFAEVIKMFKELSWCLKPQEIHWDIWRDHCSFSLFRASTGRTERTKHTRKSEHAHTRTHTNGFGTFYRRATVHLCIISSDALWLLGQSPCYSSLGSSSRRTSRVKVASTLPPYPRG